jgi:capsular exopolysaccharide synthesis family protein
MFERERSSIRPSGAEPVMGHETHAPSFLSDPSLAVHEIPLLNLLNALYRRRVTAVTTLVLVAVVLILRSYGTTPMYRAQTRILIQDERSTAVAGLEVENPALAYWRDPEVYYNTQYWILKSRGLAQRTVRKFGLDQSAASGATDQPGDARQAGVLSAITAAATLISTPRALVTKVVSALAPAPEPEPPPAGWIRPDDTADQSPQERAQIAVFLASIGVEPVPDTRLVDVTFTSADPEYAARALNAVAEEYVRQNLELRLESTEQTRVWITEELAKQKAKLEASERAMADYREVNDALSLQDRQNVVVSALNQLNDAATAAKMNRIQKEAVYNELAGWDPSSDLSDIPPQVARDQHVQQLHARLAEFRAEHVRLSTRYGPKHPNILKINVIVEDAARLLQAEKAKALERVRNDYRMALAEEQNLAAELEGQKRLAMNLDRKSVNYTVIEREARTNRTIYEALLQREKELQVIGNSENNNVQVLERADVPGAPFTPNRRQDWFEAVVSGLVLSLGLVFGLDRLDNTVKTPDDVRRRLKLPVLGLIPAVSGRRRRPLLGDDVPHHFVEAVRALRTALAYSTSGRPRRVIAVTSTQPLEGKTTTACNLAMALTLGGAKVLLIDADMRRPSVHEALGLDNSIGLSDLLSGRVRPRPSRAIRRTREPKLMVITAGTPPPNPPELLASDRMRYLLESLSSGPFDWVILDTPPVLAVTDAVVLSPMVSAVALVIRTDQTPTAYVANAVETLRCGGPAPPLRVILNHVEINNHPYYYSRYYGRRYERYYGQQAA